MQSEGDARPGVLVALLGHGGDRLPRSFGAADFDFGIDSGAEQAVTAGTWLGVLPL